MVIEEVTVLVVLVRRHRRAVGAAVRRAVDDLVPGAVEEEGPSRGLCAARAEVGALLRAPHILRRIIRAERERYAPPRPARGAATSSLARFTTQPKADPPACLTRRQEA